MDEYLDCLKKEAEGYRGHFVSTVYLGGGTPSMLSIQQIERLIKIISQAFEVAGNCEWTIEANPESLDLEKAKFLKSTGITRVSLGTQSLNNRYLKFLGRCHDAAGAVAAYETLRKAGHANISLDLMYAFPDQTEEELKQDIAGLLALKSEHLSLYTLTIEEPSRFYAQKLQLPETEIQGRYYSLVIEELARGGFKQYEVSNFARPGFQSRHNLNYWQGGNYIGLGVGAHSHENGRRWWNVARTNQYMAAVQQDQKIVEGLEELTPRQRLMERLLFGLRMNEGIDPLALQKECGSEFEPLTQQKIADFIKEGFLFKAGRNLQTSAKGQLMLDEICSRLL